MITNHQGPAFSMLYDHFVENQSRRAHEAYVSLLPTIADQKEVSHIDLLEQMGVAERILHAVSSAFELKTADGSNIHELYRNDVRREESTVSHVVSVFSHLNALIQHPAYHMLATVKAVSGRQKALGALRDIRWIYKPDHAGLVFSNEELLFKELTAGLYQIAYPAYTNNLSTIAKQALHDFTGYVYDEDGGVLINAVNFGTACVLAQSVVESIKRT